MYLTSTAKLYFSKTVLAPAGVAETVLQKSYFFEESHYARTPKAVYLEVVAEISDFAPFAPFSFSEFAPFAPPLYYTFTSKIVKKRSKRSKIRKCKRSKIA
jgi:hypothetical protein